MAVIVPNGYKQTKVGVIPEDWEVLRLKDITKIETGKTPLRKNQLFWNNGTINWITTTEVNQKYIDISSEKITKLALEKLKIKLMPINTIVLAMYGQGKTRGKVALLKIESTINQAFASIKPNEKYCTNFLFNYLDKSYHKIRDLSHGSNQENLNLDIIKFIYIPFPPLKEQEKIAQILSTWDDAIIKQEALIKAKETLKKGLMQKLLSGEVRFDGFFDEWEDKKLCEVAYIIMGQSPSSDSYNEEQIGMPLIQGNADCKNRKTKPRTYTTAITKECKIGDIIMTVRAPVGAISKSFHNACIGRGVCAIRPKDNNEFLYHYLIEYEPKWYKYSQGSTFTAVNSHDIKSLKIKLPKKEEQQKIAQILTLADKEITLLKSELEILKEQKRGLMQKLLSGEVRVKV